jgi:hypothetical protein
MVGYCGVNLSNRQALFPLRKHVLDSAEERERKRIVALFPKRTITCRKVKQYQANKDSPFSSVDLSVSSSNASTERRIEAEFDPSTP